MSQQSQVYLPVGQALTITANALSAGRYYEISEPGNVNGAVVEFAAEDVVVLGPFNVVKNYNIESDNGVVGLSQEVSGIFTQEDEALVAGDFSDKQDDLSGLVLTAVTVAGTDKVLVQDASDAGNLKTVTAQSIADLVVDSVEAATLQSNIDDVVSDLSDEVTARENADSGLQGDVDNAQGDATQALSDAADAQADATQALSDAADAQSDATDALSGLTNKADKGATTVTALANDADGAAIATAVNGIITALIASGVLVVAP